MLPSVSMTLPPDILKKYTNEVFIETGSFDGRTIQMALDCGFEKVISVEIDPHYISITRKRFAGDNRVYLFAGDSLELLPDMIKLAGKAPITYWLDAHIQTNVVGKLGVPLLNELGIIKHIGEVFGRYIPTILIDDRRLMGNLLAHPSWHSVTEDRVRRLLLDIYPEYDIVYEDSCAALKDIIVARPS